MNYNISFIKPSFPKPEDLAESYRSIVESNWFTNFGPYERRLCDEAGKFIGNNVYVATAANATLAIELAVRAVYKKDRIKNRVLIPSFTFAAGPEVLISNGFSPVFIDIDELSLQPSLNLARLYISENKEFMAGILLCNTFGVGNKDVAAWEELAEKNNLPMIIDSAAGFGSKYSETEYVGSRGDCEIFSMHATKPFAVGEGGLVTSKNEDLIKKIKMLENFGFDSTRNIGSIGTNAKLQELNCAIGLLQLRGFEDRLKRRRESLSYYKDKLTKVGYKFQPNDNLSTVAFVSVLAPTQEIGTLSYKTLLDLGIEVRRYYLPLHHQKVLTRYAITTGSYEITDNVSSRIISLPLHDDMSTETIGTITDIIKRVSGK